MRLYSENIVGRKGGREQVSFIVVETDLLVGKAICGCRLPSVGGRAMTITSLPAFSAQASAMGTMERVVRLNQTVCTSRGTMPRTVMVRIIVRIVRSGEVEFAHLSIVFARGVFHEK